MSEAVRGAIQDLPPLKGYLQKFKSPKKKNFLSIWAKRWFAVEKDAQTQSIVLSYFKTNKASVAKQSFAINSIEAVKPFRDGGGDVSGIFLVETRFRSLLLKAHSPMEMHAWIEGLRQLLQNEGVEAKGSVGQTKSKAKTKQSLPSSAELKIDTNRQIETQVGASHQEGKIGRFAAFKAKLKSKMTKNKSLKVEDQNEAVSSGALSAPPNQNQVDLKKEPEQPEEPKEISRQSNSLPPVKIWPLNGGKLSQTATDNGLEEKSINNKEAESGNNESRSASEDRKHREKKRINKALASRNRSESRSFSRSYKQSRSGDADRTPPVGAPKRPPRKKSNSDFLSGLVDSDKSDSLNLDSSGNEDSIKQKNAPSKNVPKASSNRRMQQRAQSYSRSDSRSRTRAVSRSYSPPKSRKSELSEDHDKQDVVEEDDELGKLISGMTSRKDNFGSPLSRNSWDE